MWFNKKLAFGSECLTSRHPRHNRSFEPRIFFHLSQFLAVFLRVILRGLINTGPDLNPIEHLWDVVEWEIRIMDVQPTNLQQLCDAIIYEIFYNSTEKLLQNCCKKLAYTCIILSLL